MANCLKSSSMKAEVAFVIESTAIFELFLFIFQKDEPLIHVLYEEIMILTITVMGGIYKPKVLFSITDDNSHFNSINLLPLNLIPCGYNSKKYIMKMKELDKI